MTEQPAWFPENARTMFPCDGNWYAANVDRGRPATRYEPEEEPIMDTLYVFLLGGWVPLDLLTEDQEQKLWQALDTFQQDGAPCSIGA